MANMVLEFFICGDDPRHVRWADQLREACASIDSCDCVLEVVDVLSDPQRAESSEVLATPLLVKSRPLPVERLLGDFSSISRVFSRLGLPIPGGPTEHGGEKGGGYDGANVDPCDGGIMA